ncbi:trypco2 family protein [Brucella rhizosphaerae]|uniref:trypco2 family protein n=1 Tax=Brucella rhizosphaerae TaxID=571254 RepID=UPI0004643E58|nr:trypco2 family protein [Brucella rhizosphaerae]
MELKEFIAETLSQIIDGVKIAQSRQDGSNVNAGMAGADFGGHLVNVGTYGVATRVDFDVSVTAETKGGAGIKLSVFGIGAEGGAGHTAAAANRISFSVPVRLPDGDKVRQSRIDHENSTYSSVGVDYDPLESYTR